MTFDDYINRALGVLPTNRDQLEPMWQVLATSERWQKEYGQATGHIPIDMYSLHGSTHHALRTLNAQIWRSYSEMLLLGVTGLTNPALAWWRKIDELVVVAEFLAFAHDEEPNLYALRWLHWQVIAWARRNPSNADAQKSATTSRNLFKNEPRFDKRGQWAVPDDDFLGHKNLEKEHERRKYVQNCKRGWFEWDEEYTKGLRQLKGIETRITEAANNVMHPFLMVERTPQSVSPLMVFITANEKLKDAQIAWRTSTMDIVGPDVPTTRWDAMVSYETDDGDALRDAWMAYWRAHQMVHHQIIA